jgi:signal transduction histidine kinase
MEITSEGVGLYRKRELERNAELAQRLSAFASAITHELKNPLGAAQAGAQMLREKDIVASADQQESFIKLVLRNLVRVHDLIDEIRTMALAAGVEGGERHALLDNILEKVFLEVREDARKKDVALEIEGTIPKACIDAFRSEIVMVNLIGNAIKYSDAGKSARWVRVSAASTASTTNEAAWLVTVRDNGLGIPTAVQANVFRRHFRAHPEVAEGTGLGLAITQEVTTAGGGHIAFDSEEGVGTTFRVIFPDRHHAVASAEDRVRSGAGSSEKIREVSSSA